MFITVFLLFLPEIIGNTFFFMMAHEPYNNQILTFQTFFTVFSKHFNNAVAMMTGDSPSNIDYLAKTSAIMPFVKCLFLFRICIVVMNTLIGLTVSKIDYILKKADLNRIEKTAHLCQLIPKEKNEKKWTKIKFNLNGEPSFWNYFVDTQIEDISNHSAFIRAYICDESGEKIVYCDLPCWIGINAKKILEERKTKENEMEKAQNIAIANHQQNEDIRQDCRKMAEEQKTMITQLMTKSFSQDEELKTIHDKLQAISDVQNRYLPDFEKVNTSLVQKTVALKENLEAALNDIAQLKERLQKYEEV
jgi:hypothetical protein